jgi:hypothetical protein
MIGITNQGTVYFRMDGNPVGENPSNSFQLFAYDAVANNIRQVSRGLSLTSFLGARLALDESRIMFATTLNLLGTNNGARQLYALNLNSRSYE